MSKHSRLEDVISLSSDSDDEGSSDGPGAAAAAAAEPNPARRAEGSADLDVPHALDGLSRTQLQVAIATAPEERVREAFAALVDSLPAVTERVFGMLVAVQNPAAFVEGPAAIGPLPPREPATMIPRWEVCANCGEEYDAGTERRPTECGYHTGELEVDEEAFVDWEEDVHGPMDTRENRRQYPENFTWTCCDRDGTHAGCVRAEHEPGGHGRRKRARRH